MSKEEKIKELIEVAGLSEQFSSMTEEMARTIVDHFSKMELDQEELNGVKIEAEVFKRFHALNMEKAIGVAIDFFQNNLSEEEIDQLVDIHKLPVISRMRQLTPELARIVMSFVVENQETFIYEIESIKKKVEKEFENEVPRPRMRINLRPQE